MELAQATTKTKWITATRAELEAKLQAVEKSAGFYRQGIALARFAGRADLVERFDVRLSETKLTTTNIRWALARLAKGEVY